MFDPASGKVSGRSFGTTSHPSTITFSREGLRILVGDVDDIPLGVMSHLVSIQLERSVS